jgi:hypothetical protein
VAEIHRLHTETVGPGVSLSPASVMEAAAQQDFATVLVIGALPDGRLYVASTEGAGSSLMLMRRAEFVMAFGFDPLDVAP